MAFTAKMNSKLPKEPIQTTEGDLKLLLKYKVCGWGGVQVCGWVGWGAGVWVGVGFMSRCVHTV